MTTPMTGIDLTMIRKLANGEEPYGRGPFDADHVELFQADARKLVAWVEALKAVADAAAAVIRHPEQPPAHLVNALTAAGYSAGPSERNSKA